MNGIMLTSAVTQHEAKTLAGVENWFISYKDSAPTIGQADDSLIGMFELTRDTVKMDKYHAMLLFGNVSRLPSFDDKVYTGRDIVSKLLEDTPINFKKKSGFFKQEYAPFIKYSPSEVNIEIKNGEMISGSLTKKEIGSGGSGSLFHKIHIDYGAEKTLEQIHNFQQVAIGYLYQYGFTIGIDDMILNKTALTRVRQIETNLINESRLITDKLNRGDIVPPIGKTTDEFYEEQQINILKVLDDFVEPILQSVDSRTNNLFKLILSGSKGKINNFFAIVGAIGQIIINGARIDKRFGFERTLAYFQRFDTAPTARGYIANSYMSGMTSAEFVCNSYNARFDIISKALSTSITGEKNRESVMNLQSIIIDNLRMCRKDRLIIQFTYGEDNIDPRRVIKVKFPSVFCKTEDFDNKYKFTTKTSLQDVFDLEYKTLLNDRLEYQNVFLAIENRGFKELAVDEKFMPVDVQKIYDDTLTNYSLNVAENKIVLASDEEVALMVTRVKEFCEGVGYLLMNRIQEEKKIKLLSYVDKSLRLFKTLIRSVLHSNALKRINMKILENIINEIKIRYKRALVDPGTAKGIIAAQSFSEPLTQYMLDAHKRSAEGGTSKDDVIKLKELLGARKLEKSSRPRMLLRLHEKYQYDKDKVQEVSNHIEMMAVSQFIESTLIFIESIHKIKHPNFIDEEVMIKEFIKTNPLKKIPADLTNVCIRLELNKTKLILKNMPLELIICRLNDEFKHTFIVYSPENAKKIVIRIYLRTGAFKGVINEYDILEIKNNIKNMIIRGVDGIISTTLVPLLRSERKPDGSIGRVISAWAIETVGSNIYGVAKNKYIDRSKIITDSTDETRRMYGIIAAKYRIVSEMRNIGDGMTLNHRHFTLYASEMTFTGVITPISNAGVAMREPTNYLLRMGTSAPIQAIEQAALNTAVNKITGNTAPLIMGTVPKIGTLYNSFHINEEFVKNNIPNYSKMLDEL
jgi:DNA-directed RNA polymerase II subunit RPB1